MNNSGAIELKKNLAGRLSTQNLKILERVENIHNSQAQYAIMFSKLNAVIERMNNRYSTNERKLTVDGDKATTFNQPLATPRSAGSTIQPSSGYSSSRNSKRKRCDLSETFVDEFAPVKFPKLPKSKKSTVSTEYPKKVDDKTIMIGPNGTTVSSDDYEEVDWRTAALATRFILGLVFPIEILATHTLTGKPSPAFYGRERPLKEQLDRKRVADVIHCVLTRFPDNEREIRAGITTKCADCGKKYKRLMKERRTL